MIWLQAAWFSDGISLRRRLDDEGYYLHGGRSPDPRRLVCIGMSHLQCRFLPLTGSACGVLRLWGLRTADPAVSCCRDAAILNTIRGSDVVPAESDGRAVQIEKGRPLAQRADQILQLFDLIIFQSLVHRGNFFVEINQLPYSMDQQRKPSVNSGNSPGRIFRMRCAVILYCCSRAASSAEITNTSVSSC